MIKYLCLFALIMGFANVCNAEGANAALASASASADATSAPKKAPRMHHPRAARASKPAASKASM